MNRIVDQAPFYDDLAEYYDLIYSDWEGSMRRHGAAISAMFGRSPAPDVRVLDLSAGIGTQSLPLASLGYGVVARDLSSKSIVRLKREAESRGLTIDAGQGDMREIGESVAGPFDLIIAFDNSIPHLQTDAEIVKAFHGMSQLLAADGVVLISVRDYGTVDRSPTSFHSYGERSRAGRRFRLGQEWTWLDVSHYRTTMLFEELTEGRWTELFRTNAEYYAVSVDRLIDLMGDAGLEGSRVEDIDFFQPVLRASAV